NDLKGAIAAANSFLSTTPDALNTTKGLAILVALAEACKYSGDQKGLESACKRLIAADPRGAGGERARALLGGCAQSTARNLGAADTLQLAYSMFGKDDLDRPIEICQRTLDLASGTPEEAQVGAETCLLLGAAFAKRNWLQEAAVAWDAGAEKYPTGDMAPDCLWKAVNCYVQLNGQDSRPVYKER